MLLMYIRRSWWCCDESRCQLVTSFCSSFYRKEQKIVIRYYYGIINRPCPSHIITHKLTQLYCTVLSPWQHHTYCNMAGQTCHTKLCSFFTDSPLFDCGKPQMLGFLCVQFVSGLSIVLLMNDVTVLTNCIITIIVLLM